MAISGRARVFSSQSMTLPYTGDTLEIAITRNTKCDDTTTPTCDMIPPACDPQSQIFAYQNNCYNCVNPDTCR
jgi:hypothetical protein